MPSGPRVPQRTVESGSRRAVRITLLLYYLYYFQRPDMWFDRIDSSLSHPHCRLNTEYPRAGMRAARDAARVSTCRVLVTHQSSDWRIRADAAGFGCFSILGSMQHVFDSLIS